MPGKVTRSARRSSLTYDHPHRPARNLLYPLPEVPHHPRADERDITRDGAGQPRAAGGTAADRRAVERDRGESRGNDNMKRHIFWFSSGVTSAVMAKLQIKKLRKENNKDEIVLAMCDTRAEHPDNYRYAQDVAKWCDVPLTMLASEKYENPDDVFLQRKFIKSPAGAPCSMCLKKNVRQSFENLRTDVQYFGFHSGEANRAKDFDIYNPLVTAQFPLIEAGIGKQEARNILVNSGITEPITYSMGFNNANCLNPEIGGCVKGGAGYWNHVRKVMPDAFLNKAKIERQVGHAINTMMVDGESRPVYLDELPEWAGRHKPIKSIQCGLFCGEL